MGNAEKKERKGPSKPPPSTIRLMPNSLAALFIAASVGRLSHLFPRWMSAKIEKLHDITSSQILAIFIISREQEVKMGQLAQMLDLTPRAITGLVTGLEKKNFVNRTKDENDARITWLSLTEDGKKFLKQLMPDASKKLSGLFEALTKKEQVELVRIIEKLTDHMKSQIDE